MPRKIRRNSPAKMDAINRMRVVPNTRERMPLQTVRSIRKAGVKLFDAGTRAE